MPTLIFKDGEGGESQLRVADVMTLHQYGRELSMIRGDTAALYPLLNLLGASVTDAWAHAEGQLEISFSNGAVLRVLTRSGWEAWHFQYPRPPRPGNGNDNDYISMDGDDGRLIVTNHS